MTVATEERGTARLISWDRQARRNAWDLDTMTAIAGAIEAAGADPGARCVVLRGAGKDFCVGRAGMGSRPTTEPTAYTRRNFSDVVFDAYGAMRNCPVPIIAVVQGGAHGFGCAIAAACDITIASDKAVFSVFRRASEVPIYRIEKNPRLARRQGADSVVSATGLIMRRGHELDRVLRVLDKAPSLVAV